MKANRIRRYKEYIKRNMIKEAEDLKEKYPDVVSPKEESKKK